MALRQGRADSAMRGLKKVFPVSVPREEISFMSIITMISTVHVTLSTPCGGTPIGNVHIFIFYHKFMIM